MDSISNWLGSLERRIVELERGRSADAERIAALEAYVAGVESVAESLLPAPGAVRADG